MSIVKKFVKRPIEIEAIRFLETSRIKRKFGESVEYNTSDIALFMGKTLHVRTVPSKSPEGRTFVVIPTLEGDMEANVGDWIIKGINGEFYPCKPDIFEKTYEEVSN